MSVLASRSGCLRTLHSQPQRTLTTYTFRHFLQNEASTSRSPCPSSDQVLRRHSPLNIGGMGLKYERSFYTSTRVEIPKGKRKASGPSSSHNKLASPSNVARGKPQPKKFERIKSNSNRQKAWDRTLSGAASVSLLNRKETKKAVRVAWKRMTVLEGKIKRGTGDVGRYRQELAELQRGWEVLTEGKSKSKRHRKSKALTPSERDFDDSQRQPLVKADSEPKLEPKFEEPAPEAEPELSFVARRERQQSWNSRKESEWSKVGLRSSTDEEFADVSRSRRDKRLDTRSFEVLAAQTKNSRLRFSPSAWARARGGTPRFASRTARRLGLGLGLAGRRSDMRRQDLAQEQEDMEAAGFSTRKALEEQQDEDEDHLRSDEFRRYMHAQTAKGIEHVTSDSPLDIDEFYFPPKPVTTASSSDTTIPSSRDRSEKKFRTISSEETVDKFTSPPLLPGFLAALKQKFGERVQPTPIQGLSVRWVLEAFGHRWLGPRQEEPQTEGAEEQARPATTDKSSQKPSSTSLQPVSTSTPVGYRQFLLAAETGSGKSIAYLLPLLQNLKLTEHLPRPSEAATSTPRKSEPVHSPRALILAPTHELARQLSTFAKDLCHSPDTRLRVLCTSVENKDTSSTDLKRERRLDDFKRRAQGSWEAWDHPDFYAGVVFDNEVTGADRGVAKRGVGEPGEPGSVEEGQGRKVPLDVVVGTPLKLLEMAWGRGTEKLLRRAVQASRVYTAAARGDGNGAMDLTIGEPREKPDLGFENVEYVVVDEADVLFDKDFEETTRLLLADIAAVRGRPVPYILTSSSTATSPSSDISFPTNLPLPSKPIDYPFHLILTSATIPATLNTYLAHAHPEMMRLASPRLHKLPKGLATEYVPWTGGNKWKDVLYRLKRVWAEDAMSFRVSRVHSEMRGKLSSPIYSGLARDRSKEVRDALEEIALSKVVIFCNSSKKVENFSAYLHDSGVKNVAVTSGSAERRAGRSNKYLQAFLREHKSGKPGSTPPPRKWGGPPWQTPPQKESEVDSPVDPALLAAVESPEALEELRRRRDEPRVLVTTSLLSRGLDFSPEVKHVFITDQPRNMIDFLHRAGRAARAGQTGKVVIFGKMRGRGSDRFRGARSKIGDLSRR